MVMYDRKVNYVEEYIEDDWKNISLLHYTSLS